MSKVMCALNFSQFKLNLETAFSLPLPNGVLSADSGAELEFVETALTGLEFALFSAGLLIS